MIDAITEIIKSWHGAWQFVFLFGTTLLFMVVNVSLIDLISSFFNNTLPILLRGYPPAHLSEEKESEKDDD
jgi:uncharacterized membrane protein